jgi:hypothetical protein
MCQLFSTRTIHVYNPYVADIQSPPTQGRCLDWKETPSPDFVTLQELHLLTIIGVFTYTGNNALQDIPYLLDAPRVL